MLVCLLIPFRYKNNNLESMLSTIELISILDVNKQSYHSPWYICPKVLTCSVLSLEFNRTSLKSFIFRLLRIFPCKKILVVHNTHFINMGHGITPQKEIKFKFKTF